MVANTPNNCVNSDRRKTLGVPKEAEYRMRSEEMIFLYVIAVLISLFATCTTFLNYKNAKESRLRAIGRGENDLYLKLRGNFHQIRNSIDDRFFSQKIFDFDQLSQSDRKSIQLYWYNAFDEWYSTSVLHNGEYCSLWDNYFGDAIEASLTKSALVGVLMDMLDGPISFGHGKKEEFRNAIEKLNSKLPENKRVMKTLIITPNKTH